MDALHIDCGRVDSMVAVIGLGCVFPDAPDPDAFWSNIIEGRSSISDVPPERWDPSVFYDEDRNAEDRTYCQRGGFIRDWQFDGRPFRIPPAVARVMSRAQQYALVAARQAFAQAGYDSRPVDRERAAVIIGTTGGQVEAEERASLRIHLAPLEEALSRSLGERGVAPGRRAQILAAFREEYLRGLAEITEDTFAGLCANVIAGRIANYLDLHGPSYVVDAACASSLASVDCAVDGLRARDFDLALCGGVNAYMAPSMFIGFSKFRGLSAGQMHPFDEEADGFLLGEGAGLFLLKRLTDAMKDGDSVLAVIRGVGSSSDGREKSLSAPNPKAQSLAMQRALEAAGYGAGTVQFIEAHGAATPVGDPSELEAMRTVFGPALAPGQRIAISAVKPQVGHMTGAAGAAGLMKTILGLRHKILPPTINHIRPSSAIPWDELPFDVVTEPRRWPQNRDGLPRRANVSSFGFGGNNFHLALEEFDAPWHARCAAPPPPKRSQESIAIVGIGTVLPKAPDVETFWQNILDRVSGITELTPDRWEGRSDLYLDADPDAPDKSYCRLGAFAPVPSLDPRRFRITPAALKQVDPGHLRLLACAARALEGANLLGSAEMRRRTAVIVGDTSAFRELAWSGTGRIAARRGQAAIGQLASMPDEVLTRAEAEAIGADLLGQMLEGRAPFTEDSVLGTAASTGPARIAKSMDLMGTHMVVDAACASSLAAIGVAVRGLRDRKWDTVITGGMAGAISPLFSVIASKAKVLSATGSRPIDTEADGFVAGEGGAVFVLKRLGDAVTQGDRIYGIIRGVGASSDGRGHSVYAPESVTQALALSRAYGDAGLAPATVQYVECHATSTSVGDAAELLTLERVFGARQPATLGIGSVKAQIGHTMPAAGAAGLLKTVLGLDRKTMPPMPAVASPAAGLYGGPARVITRPEPWPAPADGEPRRAGVNAFGFGGTNWHVVVEEYLQPYHAALVASVAPGQARVAEVASAKSSEADGAFVAGGANPEELRSSIDGLEFPAGRRTGAGPWRLAFVAHSRADFDAKIDLVRKHYRPGRRSPILDANGVYATDGQAAFGPPIAALFPGQGPQYADMLRDLAEEYDVVRQTIADANDVLSEVWGRTYEEVVFTTNRTAEERAVVEQCLRAESDFLQPALLTASVALHRLMAAHGMRPDVLGGHSLGEYAALVGAGMLDFQQALRAVHVRGRAFRELSAQRGDAGLMATVTAPSDAVQSVLRAATRYVTVANRNCPLQTVISGEDAAVRAAVAALEADGIECRILPIAGAFHSRIAQAVRGQMERAVAALDIRPPAIRVLSSIDLAYYEPRTDCAARVRTNLVEQLTKPVDFIGMVERLYANGARVFVEVGPKNALAGFVYGILGERPHQALFANHPKIGEIPQFDRFLAGYALVDTDERSGSAPEATMKVPEPTAAPTKVGAVDSVPDRHRNGRGSAERIWITGVSVGLPGRSSRVFSDEGLDQILAGTCLIDPVSEALQDRIAAKRITRLVKTEEGEPHFADVNGREDVIKLAGQRGRFSLRDYGLEEEWLLDADIWYQLAVAAGLECLRDARLPLQRAFNRASTGALLPTGWVLPEPLQNETAVIFASAFPGHNVLYPEFERYYAAKYGAMAASALREQYLERIQSAGSEEERLAADQWFADQRTSLNLDGKVGAYRFNRNFLTDYICMGNARFAQLVRARGPNMAVNAACSSTTVALATAEDFIRCGRARRVVVLAADDVSTDVLFEWVGAGYLAFGAAAIDRNVEDAAIPFDRRRHGMIVGMGAAGFVVEAESAARERGVGPVAELLGVRLANSASHLTRPDKEHLAAEMDAFLADMETRHRISRRDVAAKTVYVSHETFTQPTGGIGAAEVHMLKRAFGDRWQEVVVVNTKCMTGHAQGASLEDAIVMKALQAGKVPPILHSTEVDPSLAGIQLSRGGTTDREYALRFTAGLGSQVGMSLTRVVTRCPATRVASESRYQAWLDEVTGAAGATVEVVNRTLRVRESAGEPARLVANIARPTPQPRPAPAPVEANRAAAASRPPASAQPSASAPAPVSVDAPVARAAVLSASASPAPVPHAGVTQALVARPDVTETVLSVIEEKTGYEREALELDLDLEADLGIDTIKQAQVMARIRETFNLPKDSNIRVKDFPTLRHVVGYVEARLAGAQVEGTGAAGTEVSSTAEATQSARPAIEPPALAPPAAPVVEPVAVAPATLPVPLVVEGPTLGDAAVAVQSPVAAIGAAVDGDGVRARVLDAVLRIIEKQTGYEREALELDLDLEADLGIDTIKQAQAMARIREEFGLPRDPDVRVKDFPTLRHVVDYIAKRAAAQPTAAPVADVAASAVDGEQAPAPPAPPEPTGIRRMAVRWASHALGEEAPNARLGAGWTVLITDDGLGVADLVAQKLSRAGARVEIARDPMDIAASAALLGPVRGIIMLHPLAADPAVAALDASSWRRVLDRKVVASFRALKALRADLELAVAATAMAGPFGWRGQLVDPAGAGVAGLFKAFGQERDSALVKVIDMERPATRVEADQAAAAIVQEIEHGGRRVEVAYQDGRRLVPRVVPEPVDLAVPAGLGLGPESVIMAFGGSRGVTAAVVKDLARRYRPRLWLVGTRTLPANVADLARLDRDGLKDLKEKIAREWKARVARPKPVEIEREFDGNLRAIEAHRTVEACQAAGATVSYHVCNVRDGARVGELVRAALRQHGRIDGLIFGAGTIEDKLIEDKTPESFDRVFGVKAEGIFNVYKALDGVALEFFAAFSSIAGRFGNAGQSDYAAANEVLARFTALLQAARPDTRCVAVDWTGWEEVGLAARSGAIDLLKAAGLDSLSPEEGARFFYEELAFGRGPEEVVIAGGVETRLDRGGQVAPAPVRALPPDLSPQLEASVFLDRVPAYSKGAWLSAVTTLHPDRHPWLRDHIIDGTPLVPAVFGIEMMVQAASLLVPGFHFSGIRDLRLLLAIKILKDRPVVLKVTAAARAGADDGERVVRVRIASDFVGPDGRVLIADRLHFSSDVLLRAAPLPSRPFQPMALSSTLAVPALYGEGGMLPHGPTFHVIERIDALGDAGAMASVATTDERRALPSLNGHPLLTLPFAREAAFQTAGIWAIVRHGHFALPHGCRALTHFASPPPGAKLSVRAVPATVGEGRFEYDIEIVGDDNHVVDRMEGFYTVDPLHAADLTAPPGDREGDR